MFVIWHAGRCSVARSPSSLKLTIPCGRLVFPYIYSTVCMLDPVSCN